MRTGTASMPVLQWWLLQQDEDEADEAEEDDWLPPPIAFTTTGTTFAPSPPIETDLPQEPDSDAYDLRFVLDLVLAENDELRRKDAAAQREIRVWKLAAAMGATMPYPLLRPEDFEERQP